VFQTSVNNHLIFLGKMFFHDNSDFESYCHFLHQISDSCFGKLIIGSVFLEVTQVTWKIMLGTIKQNLQSLFPKESHSKKIIGADGIISAGNFYVLMC